MSLINVGDSQRFDYTGAIQELPITKNGIYKLEVWGASGGYSSAGAGGKGGYSVGYAYASTSNTFFVCVGGQGAGWSGSTGGAGGYNGGGKGGNGAGYTGAGGGGGATHIAFVTGTLAEIGKDTFDAQGLIVAGGGGGYERNTPGTGGGLSGGNGAASNGTSVPGGTQTTGYAFGQGQGGRNATGGNTGGEGNGGGGGGYFGGTAYQATGAYTDASGGGGSGFIANVKNATTTNGVNSGNGYAIITLTITAEANPIDSSTFTYTFINDKLSLESIPNVGWKFLNWQLNDYTQLEYIESTGTQYIDSGVIPQFTNFEINITDFCVTSFTTAWEDYFGCGSTDSSSDGFQFRRYQDYSTILSSMGVYSTGPYGSYQYSYTAGTVLKNVKLSDGVLYINGVMASDTGISTTKGTPTLPMYIFCRLLGNSPDRYSKIRFSRFNIIKNNILIRDFIPVFKHSTGQIGLFDLVNLKFYGNSGTGVFKAGRKVVKYKTFEYIESTGTQYIDTGIIPSTSNSSTNYIWELDIAYPVFSGFKYQGRNNYNQDSFALGRDGSGQLIGGMAGTWFTSNLVMPLDTRVLCSLKYGEASVNGSKYTFSPNNWVVDTSRAPMTLLIGVSNKDAAPNYADAPTSEKIYGSKIWSDSTTLVRDFIPVQEVYEDGDLGKIGLFDKVSKIFCANLGTSEFIPGSITGEIDLDGGEL